MHVFKKSRFNPSVFPNYSEEDYKIKFWSHLLEELFSISDVELHWGDTVPKTFVRTQKKPKIDIRVMKSLGSIEADYAVGEFAKAATSNKQYKDKLKSVLVTKKHPNSFIKNSKSSVPVPFFLIMGFSLSLLEMKFDKNKGYIVRSLVSCSFPITKAILNNGGIEDVINSVETIKKCVSNIEENVEDFQREAVLSKMEDDSSSAVESNYGISQVLWPSKEYGMFLDEETNEESGGYDDDNDALNADNSEGNDDDEDNDSYDFYNDDDYIRNFGFPEEPLFCEITIGLITWVSKILPH